MIVGKNESKPPPPLTRAIIFFQHQQNKKISSKMGRYTFSYIDRYRDVHLYENGKNEDTKEKTMRIC